MQDVRLQTGSILFALESLWAMEPSAFERLRELVSTTTPERLAAAAAPAAAGGSHPGYENRGGVAIIPLSGAVSKNPSIWMRIFGGFSTTEARATIGRALADAEVKSILMVIDSPGGTVSGVSDLADAVAAANKMKPVCAYAEDMMASAAYWIGSQAGRLVGNATASVGSIGVFAAVPDVSRLAKNLGIDVNVVKSAKGKGAGTFGTPVTDAQLAEVQRMVDATHAQFVAACSSGRGRDMSAVADGRVHMGQAAVDLGLLDAVESLSACVEKMQADYAASLRAEEPVTVTIINNEQEEQHMATETPAVEVKVDLNAEGLKELAETKEKLAAAEKALAEINAASAAADTAREVKALIDGARAERKLTPALAASAETIAKSGIEPLKAFLAALPVAAPDGGSVSEPAAAAAAGPAVRHSSDHVGVAMHAFKPETAPAHLAAIAFMEKTNAAGKQISYFDAVVAVTRR